ncbi:MAG: hypothetical protein M3345_08325 [Actinomycetota bacterium]|nr:hypothetical protein [Actinomycetota bacterium]
METDRIGKTSVARPVPMRRGLMWGRTYLAIAVAVTVVWTVGESLVADFMPESPLADLDGPLPLALMVGLLYPAVKPERIFAATAALLGVIGVTMGITFLVYSALVPGTSSRQDEWWSRVLLLAVAVAALGAFVRVVRSLVVARSWSRAG